MKYKKWTLEEINIWLNINHSGSKCLATEYRNNSKKLEWKCKEKHIWSASWGSIHNSNNWCPHCAGKAKYNIKELQEYAISKGGQLLSTVYVNSKQKLEWKCKEKHVWSACWKSIHGIMHSWCPKCAYEQKDLSRGLNITVMHAFAMTKISKDNIRTAKCNSAIYINSSTKLNWICQECTKNFDMHWNDVQQGHWCPQCLYKHQMQCKEILEKIMNTSFGKLTGNYIDNIGKERKIYFDGYTDKYKVAFEYNGEQHYNFHYFHKGDIQKFEKQRQRDIKVIEYCEENHITLITIPYTANKNLKGFIIKELDRLGIDYKDKAT